MKNKSNESTLLRPDGDRILNASLVEMDLNKFINQLKHETTWTDNDRNSITIFKSDYMTIVLMGVHESVELKTHTTKGDITLQVIDGEIHFIAEQQTVILKKGHMVALQANIPHSIKALTESFFLLTMLLNHKEGG